MSFSIAGKTAVVTGAANGVGRAIARHFVEAGANVMMADMDEKALADATGKVDDDTGSVRGYAGDLREKLNVANLLSATIDAFEGVDILVNASRQVLTSDPMDQDDDALVDSLNQNLIPSLRLSQVFARRMIAQAAEDGREDAPVGSIINLSSIAARRAQTDLMAFSVSSAALDQMTRSLAVALAPERIRVNAIAFGSVMSESLKGVLKEHPSFRDEIVDHTPLARVAGAGELAEVAQFLASDGSGFMTGQILTVDGGRTLVDPVNVSAH
ncbi:MAG: SDR family oxidoreductase [Rhodobacteraceae bacterium]|nr:SDR family oxidoreductase [Paracoccaceae bacterium]